MKTTPTPILKGESAKKFLEKVEAGLKNTVGPKPTPRATAFAKSICKKCGYYNKESNKFYKCHTGNCPAIEAEKQLRALNPRGSRRT